MSILAGKYLLMKRLAAALLAFVATFQIISAENRGFERWNSDKYSMFIHFGLYSHLGGVWDGEPVRRGYSEQIQSSTWIRHRYTRVPHPEPSSLLPPRTIPLGRLSAPAPSIQHHASNLDWRFVSYMILYRFQCHSPKSSHPLPLPQSPKDCSIHLCLFCYLTYRVIVIIFLNSIYMH